MMSAHSAAVYPLTHSHPNQDPLPRALPDGAGNATRFNPLTILGQVTSSYGGSAFLPFDLGFQAPSGGGAGTDTTISYTYGEDAGPHAVTSRTNGDSFTYDANGNMIERVQGDVTYCQTFDAENHLTTVETLSNSNCANKQVTTTTGYSYDQDGNRVKRTVGDVSTVYVAGMEIEFQGSTEDHRTVYYAAGGAFRVIGGDEAGPYFRLTDHLGSTSLIADSSGSEQANSRVVYAPFGEVRSGQQSALTDFGFTGQRHDDSTGGLMYYGARYYLPGLGRFISADTVVPGAGNPGTLNRYAYVQNHPINSTDPTGHRTCDDVDEQGNCITYLPNGNTIGGSHPPPTFGCAGPGCPGNKTKDDDASQEPEKGDEEAVTADVPTPTVTQQLAEVGTVTIVHVNTAAADTAIVFAEVKIGQMTVECFLAQAYPCVAAGMAAEVVLMATGVIITYNDNALIMKVVNDVNGTSDGYDYSDPLSWFPQSRRKDHVTPPPE